MRVFAALVALVLSGSLAAAASIPLPRPRPLAPQAAAPAAGSNLEADAPSAKNEEAGPAAGANADGATPDGVPTDGAPADVKPAEKKTETAAAPPPPSPCQVALKAIASFVPHVPVKGNGQCGIADPVMLEAVTLRDNVHVAINPPAVLRCDMATAITNWVRDEMAPLAAHLGSPLRGIENYDSYDCRGRNRFVGAKMSEHGRGNALDIKGLKLETGAIAHLTDPHIAKEVRDDLRKSACGRFMTVLGPGSDGYHEEHIHVDLAERSNDYHICQWEVRQPMDRAAPSAHIASSRSPTPHETMPAGMLIPVVAAHATPAGRRAARGR